MGNEDEIIKKAEEYVRKFDEGELVPTPETKKIFIDTILGRLMYGEALGRLITMFRENKSKDNAEALVNFMDRGRALGLIVPGDAVFRKLRECEESRKQLQKELEALRNENERLMREIEKLEEAIEKIRI